MLKLASSSMTPSYLSLSNLGFESTSNEKSTQRTRAALSPHQPWQFATVKIAEDIVFRLETAAFEVSCLTN